MHVRPELDLAIRLAREAGAISLKYYKKEFKQWDKEDHSPVTEADIATNEHITSAVIKAFPHAILAEESVDDTDRLDKDYLWCIDPIDGTKDFIQKRDDFVVMIGLAYKKRPLLGAVYFPVSDIMYFAEKGKGAFKQQGSQDAEKIQVSQHHEFSDMKAIMSFLRKKKIYETVASELGVKDIVRRGSCGIKGCLVADGQVDYYMSTSKKSSEWDTCAPEIIVEEAGGMVTDLHGNHLLYNQEQINRPDGFLMSSGQRHQEILEEISRFPAQD